MAGRVEMKQGHDDHAYEGSKQASSQPGFLSILRILDTADGWMDGWSEREQSSAVDGKKRDVS